MNTFKYNITHENKILVGYLVKYAKLTNWEFYNLKEYEAASNEFASLNKQEKLQIINIYKSEDNLESIIK